MSEIICSRKSWPLFTVVSVLKFQKQDTKTSIRILCLIFVFRRSMLGDWVFPQEAGKMLKSRDCRHFLFCIEIFWSWWYCFEKELIDNWCVGSIRYERNPIKHVLKSYVNGLEDPLSYIKKLSDPTLTR